MEKGKKVLVSLGVLCILIGFGALVMLFQTAPIVAPVPVAVAPKTDDSVQEDPQDGPRTLTAEEVLAEMKRMNPDFDPNAKVEVLTPEEVTAEMKRMNPDFDPSVKVALLTPEEVQAELDRMKSAVAPQ